jgi:L,D-transpeptidase catalytic domain
MLQKTLLIFVLIVVAGIVVYEPVATSEPAASPADKAKEDLSRVDYPSQHAIAWHSRFIRPQDTLEKLFGRDWPLIARFNRVDRRHVYPGMTIKVPDDMNQIRDYEPLPRFYEPARHHGKYILISLTEQWIGAYEYGKLKFSMPAATGSNDHKSPTGLFRIDAYDRYHTSSLYKTEDQKEQYPMDYAVRFHVGKDNVSYWIHARDLPGRPGSHGCIGVYDEEMQKRVYGIPEQPVLLDAQKLYDWAVGDSGTEKVVKVENIEGMDGMDDETVEPEPAFYGPIVEVIGDNPGYESRSFLTALAKHEQ